MKLATYLKT